DEKIQVVAVGMDFLLRDPDPQPNMTSADDRLVAVVGANIEAYAGDTLSQRVAGLIQAISRGAPYADGKLLFHGLPPGRIRRKFSATSASAAIPLYLP